MKSERPGTQKGELRELDRLLRGDGIDVAELARDWKMTRFNIMNLLKSPLFEMLGQVEEKPDGKYRYVLESPPPFSSIKLV